MGFVPLSSKEPVTFPIDNKVGKAAAANVSQS
jgi:hypothetical protein